MRVRSRAGYLSIYLPNNRRRVCWAPSYAAARTPVSTSTPVSVTSIVSSNCAERLPSLVTAVQSSGHSWSRHVPIAQRHEAEEGQRWLSAPRACVSEYTHVPMLIIGSMLKMCPGFMMPTALLRP